MISINPEFNESAWPYTLNGTVNASDSDADKAGVLSLEMTQSPFADLINKINKLIDNGLHEDTLLAYDLARTAISDAVFEDAQIAHITEKLGNIIDLLHAERALGAAFSKGVMNIPTQDQEEYTPQAAFTPAFRLAS